MIKHIYKEGSRQHVLRYIGTKGLDGKMHTKEICSEPDCEINEIDKNKKMTKNYNKIREHVSRQEHEQWLEWSKAIAVQLKDIQTLINKGENAAASHKINEIFVRWMKNWKPYNKLSEDVKDQDREYADKILEQLPFKCPIYTCGSIMITKERAYPKGKTEDDYPDGMPGDFQAPDLVCLNCKSVYRYFKKQKKGFKQ